MFLRASKQKRCRHFRHLVACESKKSQTMFLISPIKKLLFRHISGIVLIMALITIVSLSLSSIKLGNNFNCDIFLLMTVSSLFISNEKSTILQLQYWLIIDWLATNNSFWCRIELKMWISCALFEQNRFFFDNVTHVVFWKKGELFYENPLRRSVLQSQFQNPRKLDEQNWFFHDSRKNNFKFTTEQEMD